MEKMKPKKLTFVGRLGLFAVGILVSLMSFTPVLALAKEAPVAAVQSKVNVKGSIVDAAGSPVIGATVFVKGTSLGTAADIDGKFSIDVPTGSTLVISSVGFKPKEFKITKAESFNVVLEEDSATIEQVVVVGFGTQKKENLTGAVASVDVKKALESKPVTNLTKGLQGITPGLTITYSSGSLSNSPSINIRGTGTIINGTQSGSPLVLVDGIPTDLALVNPEDVANVSVLKDAASASIYGARAAFGVILITTKSGKGSSDKINLTYSGNVGWNKPSALIDFLDPEIEIPAMVNAQLRAGNANAESFGMKYADLLPGIINWKKNYANNRTSNEMVYGEDWEIIGSTPYFYRVWDPNKEMLRDYTPQTSHNLQFTGKAGEHTTYMASVGYTSEEGILMLNPEKKERYSINLGLGTRIAKWLTGDFRVLSSIQQYDSPYNYYDNSGTSGNGANGYFGYYMRWGSFFPYGTYKGQYFRHAPGFLANANTNTQMTNFVRYSANLTAEITKDVKANVEYSIANNFVNYRLNGGTMSLWDFWSGINGATIATAQPTYINGPNTIHDRVAESRSYNRTQVVNAYVNYTKTFAESHNLKAMVGINNEWSNFNRSYAERRGLMDRNRPEFQLATGDQFSYSPYEGFYPTVSEYAISGLFARLNYDYKGIYLLELNGRYDGSSKFPTDNQWGFFPSASVGYRFTQERYMESLRDVINDGKLRASVGSIGNQNIASNAFLQMMYGTTASWINPSGLISTSVNQPTVVDPHLTWEKVVTYDFGVDLRFLNMFTLSADVYQRNTIGMLAPGKTLPSSFGAAAPQTNAGDLRTRGFEVSLDFNKRINDKITVYANLSLSDYKSVVTKWNNAAKTLGSLYEGMVLGEIWGLKTDGLYQESDFTKDANGKWVLNAGLPDQSALAKGGFVFGPGDVKYLDLNGDGKIDAGKRTVDDSGDLRVIGNTTPRYQYGIRLGGSAYGFDIDVFFQGVGKRDYWAASDMVLPFYNRTDAMYGHMIDFWTPENTGAYYPNPWPGSAAAALSAGTAGSNNFITNDRYLLNMAYCRLKNLTVGYTVPVIWTKKVNVEKVRVYFSGQNLGEIKDKHLPVDPEINETEANWGRTFPYMRTLSMGVQVNF